MKKVIALSGISGAGKTYHRTQDPVLKELPCIDIADIYAENPGIEPGQAFGVLINKTIEMMETNDTVVLEAWFRRESSQRWHLGYFAHYNGWEVEYIEFNTDEATCIARIEKARADAEQIADPVERERTLRFMNARLSLLRGVP